MEAIRMSEATARVVGGALALPVEAVLEDTRSTRSRAMPRAALLTGATDLLDGHLLVDLLRACLWQVHCLVRGQDQAAARERLEEILAAHGSGRGGGAGVSGPGGRWDSRGSGSARRSTRRWPTRWTWCTTAARS
ncbi:SDR family oxidoreductase [Kitasatospora sp. NPDC058046]|uniref:SDR family oxidoreductase n=1 Tax=Kitasatospora sp. NPDC058046 TaxID=3346312 RepID=UPI0036DF2AD6